jgi:phosphatidylglycerol lysyltransferase
MAQAALTTGHAQRGLQAWIMPLVGLLLFALALWAIHRELSAHPLAEILDSAERIPWTDMGLALLFTAASYLCLSLYDPLGMQWLRRAVPVPSAALAGFISYALSHNLGLAPLTGSAARLRLYSSWGLSSLDVAALFAFNGMTLTLGMVTAAGLGAWLAPAEAARLLHLPETLILLTGALLLIAAAALAGAGAFLRRELSWRELSVRLPAPGIGFTQLLLGTADWVFAASALWILLPDSAAIGWAPFLLVFVSAGLVATLSHVPAGLGVFEAVIFLALPDTPAQPAIAAALVVFRVVYYLLPLVVAGTVLAATQVRQLPGAVPWLRAAAAPWASLLIPSLFAVLVVACGIVLLISGVTPAEQARMSVLAQHLPLALIEASHFLASLCGMVLLPLALGLRRRQQAAWLLTWPILLLGAVLSLLKGLDWEEASLVTLTALLLWPARGLFYRHSRLLDQRFSPGWLIGMLAVLLSVTWLGFFAYRHVEYGPDLWWQFVAEADAPRFLRATAGCFGLMLVIAVLQLANYARPSRPAGDTPVDADQVVAVICSAEQPPSHAWVALLGDKRLVFSDSGKSFIMYGLQGRSFIAFGGPVGLAEERLELMWRFREMADRWGGRPAFYEIGPEFLSDVVELGLTVQKIGEQGFLPLAGFSLAGGKRSGLRQTMARSRRDGSTFEILPAEQVPSVIDRLAEISDDWLRSKNAREKGFSLGRFDRGYVERFPVAVIRRDRRILAFANLWATPDKRELSIDLMRYASDAPREVMDHLFVELIMWGQAEGYAHFDLGMAPLAGLENRALAPLLTQAGAVLYQHGEHFYNFDGLRRYKEKFRPKWEPRYVAAPGGLAMARVLADAALLIGGGLRGVLGR